MSCILTLWELAAIFIVFMHNVTILFLTIRGKKCGLIIALEPNIPVFRTNKKMIVRVLYVCFIP